MVGNSGAGKTVLARRVANALGVPHLELDSLMHQPGWEPAPTEQFRAAVQAFLAQHADLGWVVDGNYRSRLGDLVVGSADTIAWLDYPRAVVAGRILRRTLGRVVFRRRLWNGNREQWSFLVKRDPYQNILLWSWTQHHAYRETYAAAAAAGAQHQQWVRLRHPAHAARWLHSLEDGIAAGPDRGVTST